MDKKDGREGVSVSVDSSYGVGEVYGDTLVGQKGLLVLVGLGFVCS